MTVTNDLNILIDTVKYEFSYVDSPNDYTVPVILTRLRAEKLISDASIDRVRFTPILNSLGNFTFQAKDLHL
jgi:hypothetical protein